MWLLPQATCGFCPPFPPATCGFCSTPQPHVVYAPNPPPPRKVTRKKYINKVFKAFSERFQNSLNCKTDILLFEYFFRIVFLTQVYQVRSLFQCLFSNIHVSLFAKVANEKRRYYDIKLPNVYGTSILKCSSLEYYGY